MATQVPGPDTLRFLLVGLCERHCLRATIAQDSAGAAESNCSCFGRSKNGYVAASLGRNWPWLDVWRVTRGAYTEGV
jgi:hypothetical protein